MKTSLLTTSWVFCYSIWNVLRTSLMAISSHLTSTGSREYYDACLQQFAQRMIKPLKLDLHIMPHPKLEPHKKYILMCNHSSLYDIPLSMLAFPHTSVRFIGKKELFKIPIWGTALRYAQFPSIDRSNREQAIQDLKQAEALMEQGMAIWLAPEGTRSDDGKFLPLKKGGFIMAINMKAHIIPMFISGIHEVLPARTFNLNRGKKVTITMGEPIDAGQYQPEERDQLMKDFTTAWLTLSKNCENSKS